MTNTGTRRRVDRVTDSWRYHCGGRLTQAHGVVHTFDKLDLKLGHVAHS